MRFVCVASLLALVGCTRATVIGTPCTRDADCNVKGQLCATTGGLSICTRPCTAQAGPSGCPVGYDCTPADSPTGALTCNKERFAFDATTGAPLLFGRSCALAPGATQAEWDQACAATGDPAASPTCRHAPDPNSNVHAPLRDDPAAYCTAACAGDGDCPVDMRCAADYDGVQKCLRRGFCDPCWMNDNCGGDTSACVPATRADAAGQRYCTKPCAGQADCGGVLGTYLACSAVDDAVASGQFCLHKYGACVGTGQVCDPCRLDADCANGTSCVANLMTGERMCTRFCTVDSECASDKPTGCDFGPPPTKTGDPIYTDQCTGDAAHQHPGALTCFF